MGRWTQDHDDHRLPDGMERVGYDADTQRYTFRDQSGALYESEPGSRYGELMPAGHRYSPEEIEERNQAVEKGNNEAVRMMLPFALLVLVFMFLLFKLINGGGSSSSLADDHGRQVLDCGQGSHQIQVEKGDTCWDMAEKYSLGVNDLLELDGNEHLQCDPLNVGQGICVPA